jgi:hypothetical protein
MLHRKISSNDGGHFMQIRQANHGTDGFTYEPFNLLLPRHLPKMRLRCRALADCNGATDRRGGRSEFSSMHARIGMMRALNRRVVRKFNPDRKDTHWGKRKLKRDE